MTVIQNQVHQVPCGDGLWFHLDWTPSSAASWLCQSSQRTSVSSSVNWVNKNDELA